MLQPFSDNKMLEALAACEPDPLLVSTEPRQTGANTETRTLSMLSDLYDRELVNIISWAKLIPGIFCTET